MNTPAPEMMAVKWIETRANFRLLLPIRLDVDRMYGHRFLFVLAVAGVVPGVLLAISVWKNYLTSEVNVGYIYNDVTVFYSKPRSVYVYSFLALVPLYSALLIGLQPVKDSFRPMSATSPDGFRLAIEEALRNKDESSKWCFSNPANDFASMYTCDGEDVNVFVALPLAVYDGDNKSNTVREILDAIESLGVTVVSDGSNTERPVLVLKVSGEPGQIAQRCQALLELKEMDYLAPDYWDK